LIRHWLAGFEVTGDMKSATDNFSSNEEPEIRAVGKINSPRGPRMIGTITRSAPMRTKTTIL
jgi:hypothetical protein